MGKYALVHFVLLAGCVTAFGQASQPNFGIKFSGFVKNDFFYDTRQVATARDGHLLLYPLPEKFDNAGKDINDADAFGMTVVQTRLRGDFTGPNVLGAKFSGAIEAEFFGVSDVDINGFRLRHGYGKLNWSRTELLLGQYWHPLFIPTCAPTTVSFNSGLPFLAFSRNPQARFTFQPGVFKLTAAVMAERDMTSFGPDPSDRTKPPLPSTQYQRNAGIPMATLGAEVGLDSNRIVFGVGGEYHELRPELVTTKNAVSNERVRSLSGTAYFKIDRKAFSWRTQAFLMSNGAHFTSIGGYYALPVTDSATFITGYQPTVNVTAWTDFQVNIRKVSVGLLAGFAKNMGTTKEVDINRFYGRGGTIDYVYRVSPRVTYKVEKLTIGFELEYTVAAYGVNDKKGAVDNSKEVANIRPLLAAYFNF